MAMVRVNIQLEEREYNIIKTLAFTQKKSSSQIIRESLKPIIDSNIDIENDLELLLDPVDEKKILKIIKDNKYSDWNDFKKEQNLI